MTMQIKPKEITIREIVENYEDLGDDGVNGFNHKLNIRPQYQREFIYKDKQRNAVLETIISGFPLNTMYWCKLDETDNDDEEYEYEIMDGQQRTISFCQYVHNDFSLNNRYFNNLTKEEQDQILDYKVQVYICEGTHKEKLDWFKVINIAGEKLTTQELRNAVYAGPWVSAARAKFSKNNCVAENMAKDLLSGKSNRQEYLETVIRWKADADEIEAEDPVSEYMAQHQFEDNECVDLWMYFKNVINWVNDLFTKKRSIMRGIEWGILYNKYHNKEYNPKEFEARISELLRDEEVDKKAGIYLYLFDNDENHLQLRQFTDINLKEQKYEEQEHKCNICHKEFEINEMDMDHIVQWRNGGKTEPDNCQLLCIRCNRGPRK